MEHDPYLPPGVDVSGMAQASVRRGWIAVVLAVMIGPAVAMLYVGRWQRAAVYLLAFVAVVGIAVVLTGLGLSFSVAGTASSLGFLIFGAVDAARLTRPSRLPSRMPWCSRSPALVAIAIAALVLRIGFGAFVMQPYQIPSSSMAPNLLVGDAILVSKSAYGVRVPWMQSPLVHGGSPDHGDIAVFKSPENSQIDYVMRVIGLPGDTVEYRSKRLYVNGRELPRASAGDYVADIAPSGKALQQLREIHGSHAYSILHEPDVPGVQPAGLRGFPHRELCAYADDGFRCKVPDSHYFAMGDNRDSSFDSRYWGFIPDRNFVGRVFLVLCSRGRPGRLLAEAP
jgi:signal peptidase I